MLNLKHVKFTETNLAFISKGDGGSTEREWWTNLDRHLIRSWLANLKLNRTTPEEMIIRKRTARDILKVQPNIFKKSSGQLLIKAKIYYMSNKT